MKQLKIVWIFLLCMGVLETAFAKKTDIQLNLKKGDVYDMKMEMENTINQNMMGKDISIKQDIVMNTRTEVSEVLKNGSFVVQQTYTDMDFVMNMNGKITNIDSLAINPLNALKEAVITFEVNPKGKVSNISGLDGLAEKLGTNPQIAGMLKGVVNEQQLSAFFSYIPEKAVEKGDTYEVVMNNAELMNLETTTVYTVKEIDKEKVTLDVSLEMDMDAGQNFQQNGMDMQLKASGTQTGDFVVFLKDGMPGSSTLMMDMNMDISFKNPQNGELIQMPMLMKMKAVTTVTKK